MARVRDIRELADYIKSTRSAMVRSHAEALIKVTTLAEKYAKENARKNFIGRNGRRLSGRLLNSIFSGVEPFNPGQSLPRGFVGTKGIPYGQIHEFGGDIVPKKAKWLWVKQHGGPADKFRRMTPTEFVEMIKKKDRRFKILPHKSAKAKIAVFDALKNGDFVKLFSLVKHVKIPERPYLRPAADRAIQQFGPIANKLLSKNIKRIR